MTQFTASEVVKKLRERFASGNDVPVPDVRLTRAEFDVIADMLEAREKAVPVAWRADWPGWRQYHDEMSPLPESWDDDAPEILPLYTHPAPSDAERLAEALERTARHRAAADGIDPDQWRSVLYGWEYRALAAHSARTPWTEGEKAHFKAAAELVAQREAAQAQPPAARVPDAETLRLHLGELTPDEVCVAKAAYRLALAAQENPNG